MSAFYELHGIEHKAKPATFADALDEYLDAARDLLKVREQYPCDPGDSFRLIVQRVTDARDSLNSFFKP